MFLTVVESKPTEAETFERRSVVVFREDMADFVKAFQDALNFMEKPESVKKNLDYSPAQKTAEKHSRTPVGFAGSEPAKKRRIVVRRKPAAPKD